MKFLLSFLLILVSLSMFSQQDTLQVAVYNKAPFCFQTNDGEIEGLIIDLWENIAEDIGVAYEYQFMDMKPLIEGLHEKKFDVGIGAISVTPEREQKVDFTHAVNSSGTTIAVAKHKNEYSFYQKWLPILKDLFLVSLGIILLLLISALMVWVKERNNVLNEDNGKTIHNLKDGVLWSAYAMTTIGYNDKLSMSRFGKVIGVLWMFSSIVILSLFIINASAQLTQKNQKINQFLQADDLRKGKIIAVANSSGEAFLKRENIPYTQVESLDVALEEIIYKDGDALVYNAPVLNYYNNTTYKNKLDIVENYLLRNNMAIALQTGSPYQEEINMSLLENVADFEWQKTLEQTIGKPSSK